MLKIRMNTFKFQGGVDTQLFLYLLYQHKYTYLWKCNFFVISFERKM